MNTARFLSIDCGTQSLRAFVFDERGELLARSQTVFNPPYLRRKKVMPNKRLIFIGGH
jgi:sugar (pentulose or hexulose) kinase